MDEATCVQFEQLLSGIVTEALQSGVPKERVCFALRVKELQIVQECAPRYFEQMCDVPRAVAALNVGGRR